MDFKWGQNKSKLQQAIATCRATNPNFTEEDVKAEYVRHLGVVIDIPVVEKVIEKVEKPKKIVKSKKK